METPLACDMTALTPEQRAQHEALAKVLFSYVEETKELDNGYAFRLPFALWSQSAEFVLLEGLCCPFFDFRLDLTHDQTAWLSLTGPEGVKDLIRAEFSLSQ